METNNFQYNNLNRDPDKPEKASIKNVQVLSGSDLSVTYNDTEVEKSDLSGACLVQLSTGDFLLSNGIDRGGDGLGVKETQSWFVQPDLDYLLEKADKTR